MAIVKGGPYVYAEVGVVHTSICAALTGKKVGRCNCGGDALLRKVLAS